MEGSHANAENPCVTPEIMASAISYCRPARDYTKHLKLTKAMNQDLYKLYLESRPDDKGCTKRLKTLWENKFQDLSHLASRHLAEQVRNIKKKKLLNDLGIQVIKIQYKADNTTALEENLQTQQQRQQQQISEEDNERENSNQKPNLEKQREDHHE